MKLFRSLLLLLAVVSAPAIASAQTYGITTVSGHNSYMPNTNLIFGATVGNYYPHLDIYSSPAPAWIVTNGYQRAPGDTRIYCSPGNTTTWGYFDGSRAAGSPGGCSVTQYTLSNASMRALCRGANLNGGSPGGMWTQFYANTSCTVDIWGPTLNMFGVSGLANFSWSVHFDYMLYATGTGEASLPFSITNGAGHSILITIYPTDPNAEGNALVQCSL